MECLFAVGKRAASLPQVFRDSSSLRGLLLYLETTAKLLKLLERLFSLFSKRTLKSLKIKRILIPPFECLIRCRQNET